MESSLFSFSRPFETTNFLWGRPMETGIDKERYAGVTAPGEGFERHFAITGSADDPRYESEGAHTQLGSSSIYRTWRD